MPSKAEIQARMDLDNKPFTRAMKRGQAALGKFNKAVMNTANRLAKMGLASASAAVVYLSSKAVQLGSYLSDVAESTGFATEEFQVFRGALIDAGGKAENMEKAVLLMQKAIVQGSEGMTTYVRAFERLGLNVEDLRRMRPEEQFQTIARAIAGAKDKQGALTAAIEIFGQRNAPRLIEVFKRLDSEGYGKMAADIEKTYGIMTASTQQALDRAADQIERFKNKATIQVGELIAMEGDGAAFKMLGLQFAKVASEFGTQLLSQILKTAVVMPKAIQAAAKSALSEDTGFLQEMQDFFRPSNNMLQGLADFNNEFYDKEIAKQQAKLEKAREEFRKNNSGDLFGDTGGSAGGSSTGSGSFGTGSGADSRLADEKAIGKYRLEMLRAQAEGDEKTAEAMRRRIDFIQRVLKIEKETTATRAEALELAKQQILAEMPKEDDKVRGKIRTGKIGSGKIGLGKVGDGMASMGSFDERAAAFHAERGTAYTPSAPRPSSAPTAREESMNKAAEAAKAASKVELTGDALTALRAMQMELTDTRPAREA